MSKEKVVQLQDKDGNIVYPILKYNDYTDEDKKQTWLNQGSISAKKDTGKVSTEHRRQVNVSYDSSASGLNSQVNASQRSNANGQNSQVNASNTSTTSGFNSQVSASLISKASGDNSQVNASSDSEASGDNSQVNVSQRSNASGHRSQVNTSHGSVASGQNSQVNTSSSSEASGLNNQVNASREVKNATSYSSVWGYAVGGDPSTQNRKVEINAEHGTVKAVGSITGNSSFADFAEYMESSNGEQLPLGSLVTMDKGQFIRVAQEGDFPVGIISATAGIILNAQGFEHKERYLYDRYGQPIYVTKYAPILSNGDSLGAYSKDDPNLLQVGDVVYTEKDEEGNDVDIKVVELQEIETQQLNPEWDEKAEYIPREDRDEWNVVGMKGQIYVNIDDTVEEGDFIQAGKDGVATKGNAFNRNWLVMEVTTPYNEELGYGIARVVI